MNNESFGSKATKNSSFKNIFFKQHYLTNEKNSLTNLVAGKEKKFPDFLLTSR